MAFLSVLSLWLANMIWSPLTGSIIPHKAFEFCAICGTIVGATKFKRKNGGVVWIVSSMHGLGPDGHWRTYIHAFGGSCLCWAWVYFQNPFENFGTASKIHPKILGHSPKLTWKSGVCLRNPTACLGPPPSSEKLWVCHCWWVALKSCQLNDQLNVMNSSNGDEGVMCFNPPVSATPIRIYVVPVQKQGIPVGEREVVVHRPPVSHHSSC